MSINWVNLFRRRLSFKQAVKYVDAGLKKAGVSEGNLDYLLIIEGEKGNIHFYHDKGRIDFDTHAHLLPPPSWSDNEIGQYVNVRLSKSELDKVITERVALVTRWNKRVRLHSGPDRKKGWGNNV